MKLLRLLALYALVAASPFVWTRPAAAQFPPPVPPNVSFEGELNMAIPKKVRVIHYYGDSFGMDPSFAWELGNADSAFVKALVKRNGLKAATRTQRPNGHTYRWPTWWDKSRIEQLPVYYRDASSGLYRVWVDAPHKRIFVEFVNL